MRIMVLTYSVRPRGGVVHAIAVAEALADRGHDVQLVALARTGESLFRRTPVPVRLIRHDPVAEDFDDRIHGMMAAYRDGLREIVLAEGAPDIAHSEDCLSANAALALRDEGVLPHVVRTVHHVDDFTSPSLVACQDRSILDPDLVVCVSAPWVERLREEFGVAAGLVANGVDTARFTPAPDDAARRDARARHGLSGRFTVLTVGGIEPRKGSLTLLEGFARFRDAHPGERPLLVFAGGATLFDYRDERTRFDRRLELLGCAEDVRILGPVADDDLLDLYRAADVFAFPSVKEGFGLAALEAMSCGLPVVATDLEVFRSFLEHERDGLLVPAGDAGRLADALARVARDPDLARRLAAAGPVTARDHGWARSAAQHEDAYAAFLSRRPVETR
ncbi:MAG: MSMEG_0565 family glycosyltransferase [Thermoleophilia bacterium]|nr:MSMEG_0565 family glycosyltransferase [Thermoleophilia bacterium]